MANKSVSNKPNGLIVNDRKYGTTSKTHKNCYTAVIKPVVCYVFMQYIFDRRRFSHLAVRGIFARQVNV